MLKKRILKIYKDSSKIEEIKKYSGFKLYLLYPISIMNGNTLGILIGITTCLSMNIFTNFMTFQEDSFLELVIWIGRFFSAVIFNIYIAKLAIIYTIIKDVDTENQKDGMPYKERLTCLIENYNDNYNKIKKWVIIGIISFIILFILIIVYPIGKYIFR